MSVSFAVSAAKAVLAFAGAVLVCWDAWTGPSKGPRKRTAFRDRTLIATAVLALAGWWNFGLFHYPGYIHWHESFHHFLGSKYQRELGYTRLYRCVAVAEAEAGAASDVTARWIRNLETNAIEPASTALDDPSACTRHFSAERWREFAHDTHYFKGRVAAHSWRVFQMDHGYNATPVWTMTGSILTNLGPASDGLVLALALLDPMLLALMWLLIWRTFGWKPACVAAIWWGTNYAARFYWTGGAFLRADWLVWMVVAVALAYRGRMFLSGAALATSALLRLIPGILACGLVLREAARMWRERTWRPSREFTAFVGGAAVATSVLVVSSSLVNTGHLLDVSGWNALWENSRKHLADTGVNRTGLRVLVAFDPDTRMSQLQDLWVDGPLDVWYAARRRTFEARAPLFWIAVAGFVALLTRAVSRRPPWQALVLAVGLLPIIGEPTSYYYMFLLLYGLVVTEAPWAGAALCIAACLTSLPPAYFSMMDEAFVLISLIVVALVVVVTALLAFQRPAGLKACPADITPPGNRQANSPSA